MAERDPILSSPLVRVGQPFVACKCCGTISPLFGVVDFHKNCELHRGRDVMELSGIPIFYNRCPRCAFLFTVAYDTFTPEQFETIIYNEDYAIVDPDFLEARPKSFSELVSGMFSRFPDLKILEYGGGNGRMSQLLREAGFRSAESHDPFASNFTERPEGNFDVIVSVEMVEHSIRPKEMFEQMVELMSEDGMILFSTLLQPEDFEEQGVNWWYVAPRNGHVSMFTQEALGEILEPLGVHMQSFNEGLHVVYRHVPSFAKELFQEEEE